MLKIALLIAALGLIALWLFVRLFPITDAWHVDPETAPIPRVSGHALVRGDGRIDSPLYEMSAEDLAAKIEEIILDTPRTQHLSGDLEDHFATYVTRSAVWGFPDIANVKVIERGAEQSELIILSRLRYGAADLGVNQARVEDWLEQLSQDAP